MNTRMSISHGKPVTGKYCSKLNIGNLLLEAARASTTKKNQGILFIQNAEPEVFLTYEQIQEKALDCLGQLQEYGLKQDDFAMLSFENNIDFVVSFWACILGGIIPAPISPPSSFQGKSSTLEKLINVWHTLKKPVLISDADTIKNIKNNDSYPDCVNVLMYDVAMLKQSPIRGSINLSSSEKPALIQFSSGSTNTPKGVILTHKNLLTNIEGLIEGAGLTSEDRVLSWMPYYHDMGLIGNHLTLIALSMFQINMHPVKFVKRPALWFDLISQHKITVTSSPNFGYRLLLKKVKDKHLETWNLSSLRLIFNGAEPISVPLVKEFMTKFIPCNLAETSMFMVYGMAEACLAVTFPTLGTKPESHCLSRNSLINQSRAEEAKESDADAFQAANEGYPIPGMSIRIVGQDGEIVAEKQLGEIQIKGDNVTSGYINNPEATRKSFQDGWLKTGDTGFMIDGKLCVTGRIKDIIFVNGQNFFAHDIEFKLEEFEGVEPGKVVVCGWHDEREGREKVALFSALRINKENVHNFYANMLSNINEIFGIALDCIVIIKSIPKTTSGKVQRFMLIQSFLNHEYDDRTLTSDQLLFNSEKAEQGGSAGSLTPLGHYADKIREIWGKVLAKPVESIEYNQPFLSLGGTSIKAVQVLSLLEDDLNLTLSHELLISCKTVADMDEYLGRLLQAKASGLDASKITPPLTGQEDDIAVIEMACRFPGASSPEEFWQNLVSGKCSIREVPEERWDIDQYYSPKVDPTKTNCRTGAFIDNPFDFDAEFFNIADQEAAIMDPQQRIILELLYELLERAGCSKKRISGRSLALFIGASTNSYYEYHLNTLNLSNLKSFQSFGTLTQEQQEAILEEWKNKFGVTDFHPNLLVDNILNMIAARTSQEFNLHGPSIVVDTACSSSLVTLHLACESLRRGECELAAAGGINLLLTPTPYIYLSNAGVLSARGEARVFDSQADGLVPGEGAGLVLLKPLGKALTDGDKVLAVIKAGSINNDGHSIGVMAPNPDGQREVIESLYRKSGLKPENIQYVEAHGTGTNIGDPSEVRALDSAYKRWSPEVKSIALGSVKANIGHLLSSAGIASFIKVVLALNHKIMPPNVNLNELNPAIKFEKTPFYTIQKAKEWTVAASTARRASINSFGFGGTNCHMVVEEAPKAPAATEIVKETSPFAQKSARPRHVLGLSAHTKQALKQKISNLAEYLKTDKKYLGDSLGDICYTENVTKSLFKYRWSVVAESCEDLLNKLQKADIERIEATTPPKVALMFTGQGSQYVGMARQLYESLPVFRKSIQECSDAFYPYLNERLTDLLYSDQADEMILAQTNVTQPVVFALDYAFGKFYLDLGVKPAYLLGHSVGEWAAACLSGAVSLPDAAKIVAVRGRLMKELQSSGSMWAVFTSGDKLEKLLHAFDGNVWLAAYNGTHQVISGEVKDLEKFGEILIAAGIGFKKLKVSQAFHTPLMKPILDAFKEVLQGATFNTPNIPLVSNVTGKIMTNPFDADYWVRHILAPVKFEQSLQYLSDNQIEIFLECGPDKILSGMASGIETSKPKTILSASDRKKDAWDICLGTLASLFSLGINIEWEKFEEDSGYTRVQLPLYPFQRKTYKPDFGLENIRVPNSWFYNWNWQIEADTPLCSLPKGNVIIFDDGRGLDEALERMFSAEKNRIYVVRPGADYSFDFQRNFTINPRLERDYTELLNSIAGPIAAVIHLWNFKRDNWTAELVFDDQVLHEDIYSLLHLGKALAKLKAGNVRLLLATNTAWPIAESHPINPQQAMAMTLALALDQENSFLKAYCLDLNIREFADPEDLAETLFKEMTREINQEGIVVVRKGLRFIRKLINTPPLTESAGIKFQEGETYLITGGASPVGGEIAKAFAQKAGINLVLTGRESLPLRAKWNNELSGNTKYARKIKLILQLEELGAKVTYETVDVTKFAEMEALILRVKNVYGPIYGVVHAAGTWDSLTFKLLDKEVATVKQVLEPKVRGAVVADFVTRNEPLKFFVMLSSVSCSQKAWSAGLGDYAAANSFLSTYSFTRAYEKAPGKSIALNYSLWSQTGMGSDFGEVASLAIKGRGLNPLPVKKAVEALMMTLADGSHRVIHILDKLEKLPETKSSSGKVRTLDFNQAQNIRETVFQVIVDQLQVNQEKFDGSQNFVELGLDSLGAVKVMEKLGQNLGMELYPTLIFEYQTPDLLAQYIEQVSALSFADGISEKPDIQERSAFQTEEVKDIAIIGAGLRIPGANTLEEYWNILKTGKCVIREVPSERWSIKDYFSSDVDSMHTSYSKYGGFIDKPYEFDPLFFGLSPSEAAVTDPQQRIFLEIAWEALQQAGYGGRYNSNNVGVFVGCEQNNYAEHFANYRPYMEIKNYLASNQIFNRLNQSERDELLTSIANVLQPAKMVPDAVAGNSLNEVAARVSHCLDIMGPSLTINTACSSSLAALHLACESLRSGQCRMAIAGGVNLNLTPTPFIGLSRVAALSGTGICYPFDSRANGMVLSEGAGAVLLKPLAAAQRDRDNILAVIKGSAINNDGHSQGLTAPRPKGQADAIRKAYLEAEISPETVSYIETHGTGTSLGDPIEIEGMTQAFRSFTSEKGFCAIGSVKSSIGHMLSASGITSLIKVVLALKHKTIPHTVNYDGSTPNPNIDFPNSPFYVASEKSMEWKNGPIPLRAGVNAFGFGGTNVHVIVEEAPDLEDYDCNEEGPPYLLQLTGRNENVLKCIAANLRHHLEQHPDLSAASLCFTLNNAQKELSTKAAAVVKSRNHLFEVLASYETGGNPEDTYQGRSNPNRETEAYLFLDGKLNLNGDQKYDLCSRFLAFNTAYQECLERYATLKNLNSEEAEPIERNQRMDSFAVQYALGVLFSDFQLKIKGILAQGTGIAAAAVLTGLITIDRALEQLLESCLIENTGCSEKNPIAVFPNCPIMTPSGVGEESLNIFQEGQGDIKSLKGFVNQKQVIIYPGEINDLRNYTFYDEKLFTWLEMNMSMNSNDQPRESIIRAFAKLYPLGVKYNPNKFVAGKEKKVVLPTYPFENETYKVSFQEELLIKDKDWDSAEPEQKRLLKLDSHVTLSDRERRSSCDQLAPDLKKLAI